MRFTRREVSNGDGGGNIFLKLKDGESVNGVLRGEIYEFYAKWVQGRGYVLVDESDPEGKSRYRINIIVREENRFVAKIWEFGITVNNQVADIQADLEAAKEKLDETKLKITRHGGGTSTEYNVLASREKMTPKMLKEIAAVPLNILEHKNKPAVPMPDADDDFMKEELPF